MTPSKTRNFSHTGLCNVAFLILVSTDSAFAEATVSLKAVAKNGVAIAPTNSLEIAPGDAITADIFLSGWNNPPFDGAQALVRTYQIGLAGRVSALSSGACALCNAGYVLPLGWDAPLGRFNCPCTDPCFLTCNPSYGCTGASFDNDQIVRIDIDRPDWIFHGFEQISAVDNSTLNVRFGALLFLPDGGQTAARCNGGSAEGSSCATSSDCPGGFCDQDYPSYLGTLHLKAGSAVCGTYEIVLDDDQTFILNDPTMSFHPVIQNLTLNSGILCADAQGACCTESPFYACETVCEEECIGSNQRFGGAGSTCTTLDPPCAPSVVIGTAPANCAIDARQPFPPNTPASRQGFTSWNWTFQYASSTDEDAPNDFTVRQVPPATPPTPPTITSVVAGPGNTVVLNFSAPIQPNRWTCVKHNASGVEQCLGAMPGDVNGNAVVVPHDILTLVDNLNRLITPPLQMYQCDIDRSNTCGAADILRLLDLIKGITGYPRQYQRVLVPCPSAP